MNMDSLTANETVLVEVDFTSYDKDDSGCIYLIYYKMKNKWYHHIPFLGHLINYRQFGVIRVNDISKYKSGDVLQIMLVVEKLEENLKHSGDSDE